MKWRVCTLARASVGVLGLGLPISEGLGWSCKLMPRSTFLWSGPLLFTSLVLCSHGGCGKAWPLQEGSLGGSGAGWKPWHGHIVPGVPKP